MDSQTLYCCLKQIKENKKKVILMALTKRGMRRTASQAAKEGYQYRKQPSPFRQMKEFRENLKPYNPKEKENPGYFKKKRNSKVTYNY